MVTSDTYGLLQYRAFKEWFEGRAGKVNAAINVSEAIKLLDGPADWMAFGLDPNNVDKWRREKLERAAALEEPAAPENGDSVEMYNAESLWRVLFLTGRDSDRLNPLESFKAYLVQHRLLDLFDDLASLLIYRKPDEPRRFISELIKQVKDQKKSRVPLFGSDDLRAMFRLYDVSGTGWVSAAQMRNALKALGASPSGFIVKDEYLMDNFVRIGEEALTFQY